MKMNSPFTIAETILLIEAFLCHFVVFLRLSAKHKQIFAVHYAQYWAMKFFCGAKSEEKDFRNCFA